MAIFYLLMGSLFTYLAINSGESVLSFWTLLPAVVATYDFVMAFRLIKFKAKTKKNNDKKT